MLQPKNVDIYYFSGTGNTKLVVDKIKEVLKSQGYNVSLYKIEKVNPTEINLENKVLGFAFPVALQGTYPFIWHFFEKLPSGNGNLVFLVDTLAAYSGGILGPVKRILRKKGYNPLIAKEIRMPSNLSGSLDQKKIEKGLKQAENFALDLIELKGSWYDIPIYSDFLSIFSRKEFFWNFFRRIFHLTIDKQKCKKCNICVNICPVGNIEIKEYPEHKDHCVFCLRCISFCPQDAIYFKEKKNFKKYKSIELTKL